MRFASLIVGLCAAIVVSLSTAFAADQTPTPVSASQISGITKNPFIVESGLFKPTVEAITQRYGVEKCHPSTEAVIESAKGEAECFQVIIPGYSGEPLSAGKFELIGPGDHAIPASAFHVYRVGYMATPKGIQLPDPLFDDLNIGNPKLPCVLWYTLTIPSDTPAGEYSGSVSFNVGKKSYLVPVRLTVWDFTVPQRGHLRTDFWFFRAQIKRHYGRAGDPGFREVSKYLEMALDHRLTPIDYCEGNVEPLFTIYRETDGKLTIDWTKFDRYAKFVIDHGGTSLSLTPTQWYSNWFSDRLKGAYNPSTITDRATGKVETVAYPYLSQKHLEMLKWYLHEAVVHFREKGWLQYAFAQPLDEVSETEENRTIVQTCHDADPAVKVLMDVVTPKDSKMFKDYLGIWCPLTPSLPGGDFQQARDKGQEVWWYVCCGPRGSYANLFTNQSCITHRQLFWQSWKYGSQGLLYWGINFWDWWGAEPKYDAKTAWPNAPENIGNTLVTEDMLGDGFFIYPGPNGPVNSIRLEAIRDGLEDYEYLWLLNDCAKGVPAKKAAHAKSLLSIPESFCKDLEHFSNSEGDLTALRREVALEIIKLEQ